MSFQIFYHHRKDQPNMIESDRGKEFYNLFFKIFLKLKNIHHYISTFTDKGAVNSRTC